jgi:zinc transport system substrate-binding protein
MKKIFSVILTTSLIFLNLISCSLYKAADNSKTINDLNKINIVATIFPPYDFARAIVGDKANLTMLINPGAEVHSFDPSPADIAKIQKSDLFIYIGGENDAWVNSILESMDTSKKKIIKLMDYITPIKEETIEGMEKEKKEDETGGGIQDKEEIVYDEHIWTSPRNAILMINAIADILSKTDTGNAQVYMKNAAVYTTQIQEVDDEIKGTVDNSPNKMLVFGDRFPFRYFVDEFGLDYRAAFNGCSTETEVSAGTMAYLINTVKENKLHYILYIELSNQNIAKAISEQTGAEMILLHSCHNVSHDDFIAGATYLSLMKQNAETLKKVFR